MFPDQYGRLNGLKINAEYFIEEIERSKESFFEYKYNPFRYDVNGVKIDFGSESEKEDSLHVGKELLLRVDLDTIREMPW